MTAPASRVTWPMSASMRHTEPKMKHAPQPVESNQESSANSETIDSAMYQALALVLSSRLAPRELAQCRAVCKLWLDAASSVEVRRSAFMHHWRLGSLMGEPRNPALLDTATLQHFVWRHAVMRVDTVTSLAVRHGCDVPTITRLNNLISHHSLHSREDIFLPVSRRSDLVGSHALFHYCRIACRELLVLLDDQEAEAARWRQQQQCNGGDATGCEVDGGDGGGEDEGCGRRRGQDEEALKGKLVALLGRSRQLDPATARFYLVEADWSLRKALQTFEQDLHWECRTPGGRRRRRRPPLQPLQD